MDTHKSNLELIALSALGINPLPESKVLADKISLIIFILKTVTTFLPLVELTDPSKHWKDHLGQEYYGFFLKFMLTLTYCLEKQVFCVKLLL